MTPRSDDSAHNAGERLLEVAAALFARYGFDGLSVRQITTAANVNLAAVSYHFGSKEGLFHAVCMRKIRASNRKKIELLEAVEQSGDATVERILDVFVRPTIMILSVPDSANLLMSRLIMAELEKRDSAISRLFREEVRAVSDRFAAAIKKILPAVSEESIRWTLIFHAGAMLHTTTGAACLSLIYPELNISGDTGNTIERMVKYAAAGLRALGA